MDQRNRSSLIILKLSRENVEVHNIDEPMWAIKNFIMMPQTSVDLDSTFLEPESSNEKLHAGNKKMCFIL